MLLRGSKIRNFVWFRMILLFAFIEYSLYLAGLLLSDPNYYILGIDVRWWEGIAAIAVILSVFGGLLSWIFKKNVFKKVWDFFMRQRRSRGLIINKRIIIVFSVGLSVIGFGIILDSPLIVGIGSFPVILGVIIILYVMQMYKKVNKLLDSHMGYIPPLQRDKLRKRLQIITWNGGVIPPFRATLGVFPLSLAGFRAPQDRIGVKLENGNRPQIIYDLWLRWQDGAEERNVTMQSLRRHPLQLKPNEDTNPPLHFFPWNPWEPETPVTICVQVDGQTGRVWQFPTELPPLPK